MKRAITFIILAAATLAAGALHAQTAGVAVIGARLNKPGFNQAFGAGVWGMLPVGQSKWQIGAAANFLRSESEYLVQKNVTGPPRRLKYNNRLYSASLLIARELLAKDVAALYVGPRVGYASIGAKEATNMADRIFAGAWAEMVVPLTPQLKINAILHPRLSPKGSGGSTDSNDPFSGNTLALLEFWLGASYTFGAKEAAADSQYARKTFSSAAENSRPGLEQAEIRSSAPKTASKVPREISADYALVQRPLSYP